MVYFFHTGAFSDIAFRKKLKLLENSIIFIHIHSQDKQIQKNCLQEKYLYKN